MTLSLGLLAAVLFAGALALTPTNLDAGTICSCPQSYTWRTAHGFATSPFNCPTTACRADAEADAAAFCGPDGVCDFGSDIYSCAIVNGQYRTTCTLQFVCNFCIDYQD